MLPSLRCPQVHTFQLSGWAGGAHRSCFTAKLPSSSMHHHLGYEARSPCPIMSGHLELVA